MTSYEVSNPTNRQVPTEIFNSKYLSNPRHPQSVTVANPRVWSPSQKNANSTYLQKEQILSPNKSINEKNKELNQKISRLLEYIRFDQSRRRSLMERDSKGNGRQGFASGNAVAFGFGSNGGFGVRSKIANESINPFRVIFYFLFLKLLEILIFIDKLFKDLVFLSIILILLI